MGSEVPIGGGIGGDFCCRAISTQVTPQPKAKAVTPTTTKTPGPSLPAAAATTRLTDDMAARQPTILAAGQPYNLTIL